MDRDKLKAAVRDLHWMARRYADGRCSYAPGLFNDRVRSLMAEGFEFGEPLFARDGMGRAFDGLTDDEAAAKSDDIIAEIADERARQIGVEGWTPDHDDTHAAGELLRAAVCYAQHPITHPMARRQLGPGKPCDLWPWEPAAWKPKNGRRDLVRAAALIVAEIERLDRLMLKYGSGTEAANYSNLTPQPIPPSPQKENGDG